MKHTRGVTECEKQEKNAEARKRKLNRNARRKSDVREAEGEGETERKGVNNVSTRENRERDAHARAHTLKGW